jgi:Negative regulator of beta-lactamase expression
VEQFPSFANPAKIERRAQKIADPIERLRYLRRAAVPRPPSRPRWRMLASFCFVILLLPLHSISDVRRPVNTERPLRPAHPGAPDIPAVWLVDQTAEFESYSNGLRIEKRMAVSNEPRWYPLLSRDPSPEWGPRRSDPAGIVYHTTESDQVPFEPHQSRALKHIGRELLVYVRNKRAYHYVIDRFGSVHRIVAESDAANHAGHSVWADSRWLYVDLNSSFLGVAFEGQTETADSAMNPAQIHAAKVLTEMLRSKYNIPVGNCVTHAQVSVNPGNMRIGWHTDWGINFPFDAVGLPDNYAQPSPALFAFGFSYDDVYLGVTGGTIWKGLALAEEQMRESAAQRGLALPDYRKILRTKYQDQIAALKDLSANANKELLK